MVSGMPFLTKRRDLSGKGGPRPNRHNCETRIVRGGVLSSATTP